MDMPLGQPLFKNCMKDGNNIFVFQGKASKRKHVLDEAYGQQGFLADSRDLVNS